MYLAVNISLHWHVVNTHTSTTACLFCIPPAFLLSITFWTSADQAFLILGKRNHCGVCYFSGTVHSYGPNSPVTFEAVPLHERSESRVLGT